MVKGMEAKQSTDPQVEALKEAITLIEKALITLNKAKLDYLTTSLSSVGYLLEAYRELLEEKNTITKELDEIYSKYSPIKGSLVYKWVKNKIGKKYWYWYLHVKEGNRTRSIYIGAKVPKEIIKSINERARIRRLEARLRYITERMEKIEEALSWSLSVRL